MLLSIFQAVTPNLTSENLLPLIVFITPNALFALAACFLYIDFFRYQSYIPLYIAGKAIGETVLFVFFITNSRKIFEKIIISAAFMSFFLFFVLFLLDLLTIIAGFVIQSKKRQLEAANTAASD